MDTWGTLLTWFLLIICWTFGQSTENSTKERRLLLNDPNTLLNHIESLQHEMTSLKSQVNSLNTEVNTLNLKVNSLQSEVSNKTVEVTTCKTELHNLKMEVDSLNMDVSSQKLKVNTCKSEINKLSTEVTTLDSELRSQRTDLHSLQSQLVKSNQEGTGSVYTVWGRKYCPAVNGTTTIYTGITGGKPYHEIGGGVNTLCLPHNPDDAPSDFPTKMQSASKLYGSEYQFNYRKYAQDDDVPCAACHVESASSVLMIPSKSSCPTGWNMQYNGYLTSDSNYGNEYHAFDYICLHNDAEYLTEGARQHNLDGHILFPVQAACGSLPCPPYRNGQFITCVVCTL